MQLFKAKRYKQVTICPCCGFRFEGELISGCEACGARAVGEPLPKPEYELPFYGRSLLLAVTGALMVLAFLTETIIAFFQRPRGSFGFWSWVAAGETASWKLKWIALPVTIIVLWGTRKIYASMLRTPERFCAMGYARSGLLASAIVPLLIALLIGITVPERLRQHQRALEAASYADGYTYDRALRLYRTEFGRLPAELNDLIRAVNQRQLPDPDGSIISALNRLDSQTSATGYTPRADVAALPKQGPRPLRGAVIRKASINTVPDDTLAEGLAFTNYELRLPGPDKVTGTDDDLIVRDGVITKVSEDPIRNPPSTSSSKTTQP